PSNDLTPCSELALYPLWRKARRVYSLASRLPGTNRLGFQPSMALSEGNTGDRAGDQMRRGTILISGNAGDYCASRMIAGTLVVLGESGAKTGLAMRRGTLLLSQEPVSLPATFNDNGKHNLNFLTLLTRSFQDQAGFSDMWERGCRVQRWLGDLGCNGKGEIPVWY
ncbi:MAG: hypothetical protein KZQ78_02415, partial [Candidatus Thiodiazotropha sp. (ex Ustalcina ferruginea)]|nr:hypothetical protein [Candidatus Thiodiazotropha sp. (ex Ustalcina ferruginea)]